MKILGLEIRWPSKPKGCRFEPKWDGEAARGPHCDPLVIHPPQICALCDEYVDLQAERIHQGVNFTGQSLSNRETCPAERQRPLEVIHAWPGNRPVPHKEES